MTTLNTYLAGNVVVLTATFTTVATSTLTDPTTITLKVGNTATATTTYTYAASQITRVSTGVYQVNIDTTGYSAGTYGYEWLSTGPAQAVAAGAFVVQADPL